MEPITIMSKRKGTSSISGKNLNINRAKVEQTVDIDGNKWSVKQKIYTHIKGVAGYGTPISKNAARKMIGDYWEELKVKCGTLNESEPEYEKLMKSTIAVTFGREALLAILSQPECEGIRFYFSKKPVELENINSTVNQDTDVDKTEIAVNKISDNSNNSLVAIGITKNGNDIGCAKSIMENVTSDLSQKSVKSAGSKDNNESNTLIREIVPPSPIKDLLKIKGPSTGLLNQLKKEKFPYESYLETLSNYFKDIVELKK